MIFIEAAVGGGQQLVLGPAHHDIEAGIRTKATGDRPDLGSAVAVGHFANGSRSDGRNRKRSVRDRCARGAVHPAEGRNQDRAVPVDEQNPVSRGRRLS